VPASEVSEERDLVLRLWRYVMGTDEPTRPGVQ
jgi:hypothetical protein